MVTKWKVPFTQTMGVIKMRIGIDIARANHRCIRGYQVSVSLMILPTPHWEGGAGIKLFRTL